MAWTIEYAYFVVKKNKNRPAYCPSYYQVDQQEGCGGG
jgi:hypothetical protein